MRYWYALLGLALLCSLAAAADECPAPPFTLAPDQICWLGFPIVGVPSGKSDPPITEVKKDYRLGLKGDQTVVWQFSTGTGQLPSTRVWLGPPLVGRDFRGTPPPWSTGAALVQVRFASTIEEARVEIGLHQKGQLTWRFRDTHADLTAPMWLGTFVLGWPNPETTTEAQTLPAPQFRLGLAPNARVVWEAVSTQ